MDKMVLFKRGDTYAYTTWKNYNSYVWNARLVHDFPKEFTCFNDCAEYMCKYLRVTIDDIVIIYP